jgi:DNA-binding GntR family transcriptional regulator
MVVASATDAAMAERGVHDHRGIVDAVRARNLDLAEQIMSDHLDASLARLGSDRRIIRRSHAH